MEAATGRRIHKLATGPEDSRLGTGKLDFGRYFILYPNKQNRCREARAGLSVYARSGPAQSVSVWDHLPERCYRGAR
jgi:hypothetical protein